MAGEATVVLVHGAWHGAWAWDDVASRLRAEGVVVAAVELASVGDDGCLGSVADDVAVVRAAIDGVGGPEEPEWWITSADGSTLTVDDPVSLFFNDTDVDVASHAAVRLRPQSKQSLLDPVAAAAWHDTLTTYVVCERDQAIPPFVQEISAGHTGSVRRLDTSHSPFLSQPDEVVALVRDVLPG